MSEPTLYGFDASTFVRTVRMLLAEKEVDYEQVPVDVLAGETRQASHLERHPFGKIPVLVHDGLRIIETGAIVRYVDDVFPGPSFVPDNARDRARMDMALGIVDAYGYAALIGGVAAYHLFPDLVGGKDERARADGIDEGRKVLAELMRIRGESAFIAGERPTLADFYVAPLCFYVQLTDDAERVLDVEGFPEWWERVQALPSYAATEPDLG